MVDSTDRGGLAYGDPKLASVVESPLLREINQRLRPKWFIDVGANYGFMSRVQHVINPDCTIVAVEPSPRLHPYLEENLSKIPSAQVVHAACGAEAGSTTFSLHPHNSQDNRVRPDDHIEWTEVTVAVVRLDDLLSACAAEDGVIIKVDTQGFEAAVFDGASAFFARHFRWLVLTEFAPYWLDSQGADPASLLASWCERFEVAEMPARCRYRGDSIDALFASKLTAQDAADFVAYQRSLARGQGWCDLLMRPRRGHFGA